MISTPTAEQAMSALTLAAVDYILCCTALRDSTGSYEQAEARLSEIAKYSGDIPREQIVEVIEAWLGTGEKITRGGAVEGWRDIDRDDLTRRETP